MSKDVRLQAFRLSLVYGLLAALVAWKHAFVLEGLLANVYLNGLIIGIFLFGSAHGCLGLARLRNEILAFRALKEVYRDAVDQRSGGGESPASRLARCRLPGVVVRSPKLLGHVYDLALEELLRTRHVRISVATMQSLVQAVSSRIAADRSMLVYITGMCVFLGLIGTFIGLMEMVGSVGTIIGGLAASGPSGDEAMVRLIHDLEAPLKGMATGFSSSLFGLFCSLVLGLANRFVNAAALRVKDDFEGWLAGISQLENETTGGEPAAGGAVADEALLVQLRRSGDAIENAAAAVRDLAARQAEHAGALVRATAQTEAMAGRYVQVARSLERIDDVLVELAGQRAAITEFTGVVGDRLDQSVSRVTATVEQRHGEVLAALAGVSRTAQTRADQLQAGIADTATLTQDAIRRQEAARAEAQHEWKSLRGAAQHLAASLQLTVTRAEEIAREAIARVEPRLGELAEGSAATRAAAERIGDSVGRLLAIAGVQAGGTAEHATLLRQLADGQAANNEALSSLSAVLQREPQALALALGTGLADLARSVSALEQAADRQTHVHASAWSHELRTSQGRLEQAMNTRFGELARSFEASFMAYAELLRRVSAAPAVAPAGGEADSAGVREAKA